MILVDTSVWINLFGKKPSLRMGPDTLLGMAICPPILQEVLQGVRLEGKELLKFQEGMLALHMIGDPLSQETFLHAADLYRTGRQKGFTIRSSIDCLIAALAIEVKIPVWHQDRDFTAIAKFTSLQAKVFPSS